MPRVVGKHMSYATQISHNVHRQSNIQEKRKIQMTYLASKRRYQKKIALEISFFQANDSYTL